MKDQKNKNLVTMRRMDVPGAGIHLREADGETPGRTITGYAILFNNPSEPMYVDEEEEIREVIDPSAVSQELLDGSDIKFTMYHDRHTLLGRSNKGEGTLRYFIDETGVGFELELPNSPNGDEALELVKRGDISGCSFAFSTHYYDRDYVAREVKTVSGRSEVTYRVKVITGIYDFTLTDNPAYTDTSVESRDFVSSLRTVAEEPQTLPNEEARAQIREMREAAGRKIRYNH